MSLISVYNNIGDSWTGLIMIRQRITYSDVATAATSNTYTVYSLPPGWAIVDAWANVITSFNGGAISAYVMKLGTVATDNEFMVSQSIFGGGDLGLHVAYTTKGTSLTTPGQTNVLSNSISKDIILTVTSTNGNLDTATQGVMDIYLQLAPYPFTPS